MEGLDNLKIIKVGSSSKIKLAAVRNVFPSHLCVVTGYFNPNSIFGVEQPIGLKDTYKGATGRHKQQDGALYNVCIENGIMEVNGEGGWVDFPAIQVFGPCGDVIATNEYSIKGNAHNAVESMLLPSFIGDIFTDVVSNSSNRTWSGHLKDAFPNARIDLKDPHKAIANVPRRVFIEKGLRRTMVYALTKPEIVADHPKKGVSFVDFSNVYNDPIANHILFQYICKDMLKQVASRIDVIAGIESRGFDIAHTMAYILGKKFVRIRKQGKLPGKDLVSISYKKEYGDKEDTIEMKKFTNGERVLIVDDILATGGTMDAAVSLVGLAGGAAHSVFTMARLIKFKHKPIDGVGYYCIHALSV